VSLLYGPFGLYWGARVVAVLAFHMQAVAVGWQLYMLTGSALDLGLVGLVQFVPMFVLTLPAGQMADRFDRRRVVSVCQLVETSGAVTLALGSLGGWLTKESMLAIVTVVGAARAVEQPSVNALMSSLVPARLIPRASALSASAQQSAQIVGPALGGLLYAVGPHVAYASAATLFFAAAVCSALIPAVARPGAREPITLESVFSGIAFIRRSSLLVGTMSLDLFAVLLGGATALLPIYARDILGTGPWGLGLLRSAPAVGALGVSLALARYPMERRVGRTLFRSVIAFGLATVVFALSRRLVVSLAALAVLGASDVVSVVIRFSLVQIRTPEAMRGRVNAVRSLFTGTSNHLGELESGVTAALFGIVPAVVIGGLGTIAVAVLWMALFPDLWRLRTFEAVTGDNSLAGGRQVT
jgi:MFS family permease